MAILDEIRAKCPPALIARRDDVAVAARVSDGRVKPNKREFGNGSILETLGLAAGNAFLDVIYTAPNFRYLKPLLEQGRLVVGSPLMQATLQSMAPLTLTQVQADALCALGLDPDPVTALDVRVAMANNWV